MQIIRGRQPGTLKVVIYGPEGIGKSTFASRFPNPLFIDTEGSTRYMNVARTQKPTSWALLQALVKEVQQNPSLCKTLVLDTADWAERLCIQHVCISKDVSGIEDFGYGKGYTYVYEEFGKLLNQLSAVCEQGIHVVVTAHAILDKFEQPNEMGAYDRWRMKLIDSRKCSICNMVKEWADMVLFADYETIVVNVDGKGAQKGKNKAQGGKRVMYTTHTPYWDAKNRFDLKDKLPFQYSEIEGIVGSALVEADTISEKSAESLSESLPEQQTFPSDDVPFGDMPAEAKPQTENSEYSGDIFPDIPDDIPQALKDLMLANHVTATDIQTTVSAAGYFPLGMPMEDYPEDFIEGCLIGAWDAVFEKIKEEREKVPF